MSKLCSNSKHPPTPAVTHCKECRKYYCEKCQREMHEAIFPDHTVSSTTSTDLSTFTNRCDTHSDYPLDYYCTTHTCMCCAQCVYTKSGEHRSCDVRQVSTMNPEQIMKDLKNSTPILEQRLTETKEVLKALQEKQEALDKDVTTVERSIKVKFSQLREELNKKEKALLDELERVASGKGFSKNTLDLTNVEDSMAVLESAKKAQSAPEGSLSLKEALHCLCTTIEETKKLEAKAAKAIDAINNSIRVTAVFDEDSYNEALSTYKLKADREFSGFGLRVDGTTDTSVSLSWNPAPFENVWYHIHLKGKTFKHLTAKHKGQEPRCTVEDLCPDTEYQVTLQAGTEFFTGAPAQSIVVRTNERLTEGTLSLSSEHFNFVDIEESDAINSIDQASQLFTGFSKKPPTLEEALESIGYEKAKELTELFTKKATEKMEELDAPGLTVEDTAAILCYTFEWNYERFGDDESPYRKLNTSLSVDRSNAALKKTRGFLFLLLQALRKLPRFIPSNHTLYRGIRAHMQTEPDPEFPERKPYAAGNKKTWWAFTSTTTSLEATIMFLGDREATLSVLGGKPWGYSISLFSDFPDEIEILLEPERRLKVTSVSREGQLITVNAEMLDTPLVLENVVKVPQYVKPVKAKKVIVKEVPKDLKAENITDRTVELSWSPVEKWYAVKYQVVMKKAGIFNRRLTTIYEGTKTKCTVDNLEPGTEYEFLVQCNYRGSWGEWSKKVTVTTLK